MVNTEKLPLQQYSARISTIRYSVTTNSKLAVMNMWYQTFCRCWHFACDAWHCATSGGASGPPTSPAAAPRRWARRAGRTGSWPARVPPPRSSSARGTAGPPAGDDWLDGPTTITHWHTYYPTLPDSLSSSCPSTYCVPKHISLASQIYF